MAAGGPGQQSSFASRSGLPTFGNFGSALLERGNPGLRKSTPDSEALASSDEEVEQSRLRSAAQRKPNVNRRSSLLMDQNNNNEPRRLSFANVSHSPAVGSQPNTPGASHETWSAISPGAGAWSSSSAYPFGTNIWGANSRDLPTRLQEVRQDNTENRLSYHTPSQPNPSVHRSMSFSVGQNEYEPSQSTMDAFSRPPHGLNRRSSRPGTLGYDYGGLARVNESEDNEPPPTHNPQFGPATRTSTRTMSNNSNYTTSSAFRGTRLRNPALEGAEIAIEDVDEPTQLRQPIRGAPSRRLSDFQSALPTRQSAASNLSIMNLGNARNTPHWSSNLDFGQLDTIPQSRRHSFADVPTRRGSMGSNDMLTRREEEDNQSASYDASSQNLSQDNEPSYFNRNDAARRVTEHEVQQQLQQEHHQAVFGVPSPYGILTSSSSIGAFQGPNPMPLYVEGTGLSVKEGDLVIVEADRGTDMGCVQHSHVSWEAARKYKARYAEQHFGWLMMFSQQTRSGGPNLFNPNAVAPGRNGAGSQGTAVRDSDLKPKMIKRLAQTHEIQALQEKEGNEAKAKRVCQQKVAEHNLNMEILDAEFQMDGKKLTFYFFSTEYINFNSLVTDLFKMYKTRIWMSAINPASFQSPVSSLGLTPIQPGTSLSLSSTPAAGGSYDDGRVDPRYMQHTAQMTAQRGMPPLYYGGYGQPPQLSEYASFSPNYQQPTTDPFSNYNTNTNYGSFQSRPQNLPVNRGAGGRNSQTGFTSPSTDALLGQFGSMSLTR
ncbi:hypothetical protein LTS08_001004 [Lithohypha guttulata]|nr:hypothetical protein LTS08_001004 [Lithohypha guttulata]